jgi:hypothetical protein
MWLHLLTIIFVCAKILVLIDWSWWLVFLPSIIAVVIALLMIFGVVGLALLVDKGKNPYVK